MSYKKYDKCHYWLFRSLNVQYMYNQIKRAVRDTAHGHQRRVLCPIPFIITFGISSPMILTNPSTGRRMNIPIITVMLFWYHIPHVWRGSHLKVNAKSKGCIRQLQPVTLRHGLQATICLIPIAKIFLSGIRLNQYREVNSLLFFVKDNYTQTFYILRQFKQIQMNNYTQIILSFCFRIYFSDYRFVPLSIKFLVDWGEIYTQILIISDIQIVWVYNL